MQCLFASADNAFRPYLLRTRAGPPNIDQLAPGHYLQVVIAAISPSLSCRWNNSQQVGHVHTRKKRLSSNAILPFKNRKKMDILKRITLYPSLPPSPKTHFGVGIELPTNLPLSCHRPPFHYPPTTTPTPTTTAHRLNPSLPQLFFYIFLGLQPIARCNMIKDSIYRRC